MLYVGYAGHMAHDLIRPRRPGVDKWQARSIGAWE
jgi:hypothetical protein